MATVKGTAFDASTQEYDHSSQRDDTRAGSSGHVVLRDLRQRTAVEVGLDASAEYRLRVSPGIYEIQFLDLQSYLPYRRARVRLAAEPYSIVMNVYLIPHTGTALTIHGDVSLPDPVLSYDDYHPDLKEPDLDLLVQYRNRTQSANGWRYEGPFLMVTFDAVTLRARTCYLDPATLMVTAADEAFVDLGSLRVRADRVELRPRDGAVRVFVPEGVQEYRWVGSVWVPR